MSKEVKEVDEAFEAWSKGRVDPRSRFHIDIFEQVFRAAYSTGATAERARRMAAVEAVIKDFGDRPFTYDLYDAILAAIRGDEGERDKEVK